MAQQHNRTHPGLTGDLRTEGNRPVTVTVPAGRDPVPRYTRTLLIPLDPAASEHRWPELWPYRSELELAALNTAPGSARGHARAVLWEWQTSRAAAEDALMVVSELVTNAVTVTQQHDRPDPVRLWLLCDGASVLILVWDATSPAPVPTPTTPEAEQGRGLAIVEGLSARWGWYFPVGQPGGKVVWALTPTAGPAGASSAASSPGRTDCSYPRTSSR